MSDLTRTISVGLAATDFLDFHGSEMTPIQFASSYARWLKGDDQAASPKPSFQSHERNELAESIGLKAESLEAAILKRPSNTLATMLQAKADGLRPQASNKPV